MTDIVPEFTNLVKPSPEKIEIVTLRRVRLGNVRAFARVRIGTILIDGWKVVQQPGQRAWVSVPQTKNEDGQYFNLVQILSPTLRADIDNAILAAYAGGDGA